MLAAAHVLLLLSALQWPPCMLALLAAGDQAGAHDWLLGRRSHGGETSHGSLDTRSCLNRAAPSIVMAPMWLPNQGVVVVVVVLIGLGLGVCM